MTGKENARTVDIKKQNMVGHFLFREHSNAVSNFQGYAVMIAA